MALATLLASEAREATGDGDAVVRWDDLPCFRTQLDVTATDGTDETLDVIVQDSIDGSTWNDLVTFTQATGVTREVKNHTTPFGEYLRAKYTIAGTDPSFTFSVVVSA